MENDNFHSEECAEQLKALSEPIRLRIVDALRHGEMTVGNISELLKTALVTVSHHLQILRYAGLVEPKRNGRFIVYRLRCNLIQKAVRNSKEYLNLGCCRIEVPPQKTP